MSASREKKRRQDYLAANGGIDPKAAREADRQKAEKRSLTLYTTLAIVIAVLAVAMFGYKLVNNSSFLNRSRTAVTIDGVEYSVADVSYYYYNAYRNEMQNGYANYFIDTTQPLSAQTYIFDTSMTWAEHFRQQAITTMKLVHAAVKNAEAEGMTLGEEELETLNAQIEYVNELAEENNVSYKQYLTSMYGQYMTPEIYEENLELSLLATMYTTAHYDSLTYTDDEIQAYYEENKNTYDTVDGIYVTVSGTPETKKDEDGKEIEPTDEEKAAALNAAKELADNILVTYEAGEENLESYVKALQATYTGSTELKYTAGTAMDWLFDESRVAGDHEVLFDKESSTYYVVIFNSRQREEALCYNIRHILITEANLDLAEGAEPAEGELLLAAQTILDKWDGTEEGFAALAEEYTQDTGSVANGGLYENVNKGDMVSQFNDWCYAEGRKAGDTGIVETTYGQHIMYFVGYGDTQYWYNACKTAMANEAYTEWETALVKDVTAETSSALNMVY